MRELPPGKVVVTATSRELVFWPPKFPWRYSTSPQGTSIDGATCLALDWKHLSNLNLLSAIKCEGELTTAGALNARDALDEVLNERVGRYVRGRIDLEVKGGKAYYVSVSFGKASAYPTLKLMDPADGLHEISTLRLAMD